MKKFVEPYYEVICFVNNVISTSACSCYDGLTDYGPGSDECIGKNLPECTCGLDNPVNCVEP